MTILRTITWPADPRVMAWGRNGISHCTGLNLWHLTADKCQIAPLNFKGVETRGCSIDLPADPGVLRNAAALLMELAHEVEAASSVPQPSP
jgi:hypothetical protein